jgi:hypothetical protein
MGDAEAIAPDGRAARLAAMTSRQAFQACFVFES